MSAAPALSALLAVGLSPLLLGVISRTKALVAGRTGQPLLQPYHDLRRLLGKGAVYSDTATWIFRAGPPVGLAAVILASLLIPLGGAPALVAFPGDFLVVAGLLGLMRFFTVIAALDTGSSFEGMGASREVQFSALAEPALLLGLGALATETGQPSLSGIASSLGAGAWSSGAASLALVAAALFIVLLAENARIPVDDPATHLELTMVHEVMVLDHSGPDLAFIQWAAAIKLWLFGALLAVVLVPVHTGAALLDLAIAVGGLFAAAVAVGLVESSMARLRLARVPQLLLGACMLSAVALALVLWSAP